MSAAHTRAENTWTPHGVTKNASCAGATQYTHAHSVIVARLAAPATFGAFGAYIPPTKQMHPLTSLTKRLLPTYCTAHNHTDAAISLPDALELICDA